MKQSYRVLGQEKLKMEDKDTRVEIVLSERNTQRITEVVL